MAALPPGGKSITLPLHRRLERAGAGGVGGGGEMTLTVSRVEFEGDDENHSPAAEGKIDECASGGNGDAAAKDNSAPPGADSADVAADNVTVPRRSKRIFFVRHGESAWNEAQREMQLAKMIRFDHPLNARGVQQAQQLAARA